LNVLMSKMVTDWFVGREIATAMGIFVNSWPVGIALALIILPFIGMQRGIGSAALLVTGLVMIAMVALMALYRTPPEPRMTTSENTVRPSGMTLRAVIVAGLIWGLFNASIAMIFSFGPSMLAERGWSVAEASSATSVVLWLVALSVPLGGFLADRTGWPHTVLLGGFLAFASMLVITARTDAVLGHSSRYSRACVRAAGWLHHEPSDPCAPV
jgi:cyanate permease